jgi:hypothetical protein
VDANVRLECQNAEPNIRFIFLLQTKGFLRDNQNSKPRNTIPSSFFFRQTIPLCVRSISKGFVQWCLFSVSRHSRKRVHEAHRSRKRVSGSTSQQGSIFLFAFVLRFSSTLSRSFQVCSLRKLSILLFAFLYVALLLPISCCITFGCSPR